MKISSHLSSIFPTAVALSIALPASAAPRSASFDVTHELKVALPKDAKNIRIWFAMPQKDPLQKLQNFRIAAPFSHKVVKDSAGNETIFIELKNPKRREFTVTETFNITRMEQVSGVDAKKAKSLSARDRNKLAPDLSANTHILVNDDTRKLAAEIVGKEKNSVVASRKIYDWVLANIDYWVKDPKNKKASPVGSSEYCLSSKTGNCTDFHSLYTSLSRSAGIPTRMVYGSFFKADLNQKDADQSYHCWPEFYVKGIGWVPNDVAVADLYTSGYEVNDTNERLVRLTTADGSHGANMAKVDYYFGNLDERRVTWSRGRDLILSPKPANTPLNAMTKAYVEIDGKAAGSDVWARKLTFSEKK